MRKTRRTVRFANATEEGFARLLHRLRIRWQYEPHTFVLRTRQDGSPALGFTPDFYLPDLGIYFELTTLRQKLVTAKNRKARLLSEQRPDVRLRILYRHDCQQILRPSRSRRGREAVLHRLLTSPPPDALRRAGWLLHLNRTVRVSGCISVLGVRLPLGPEWAGHILSVWVYSGSLEVESEDQTIARFPCTFDSRSRTLRSVEPGELISLGDVGQVRLSLPELEQRALHNQARRRPRPSLGITQLRLPEA